MHYLDKLCFMIGLPNISFVALTDKLLIQIVISSKLLQGQKDDKYVVLVVDQFGGKSTLFLSFLLWMPVLV